MRGIVAMAAGVAAAGALAACAAEDPLAHPLALPTTALPASANTPLPAYVERVDAPSITVRIDGARCAGTTGTAAAAETCR